METRPRSSGGSFDGVVTFGEGQGLPGGNGAIFRVTAAIGERTDLVAELELIDALSECNDLAGDFQPEDGTCTFGWRIDALSLRDVWTVNPRRLDLNEYLPSGGLRQRRF